MKKTGRLFSNHFYIGVVYMLPFLWLCGSSDKLERSSESSLQLQQTSLASKSTVPLSSDGTMQGVTLQRTRAYAVKSPPEPKTIVWKSAKLFTLRRSQWVSAHMGTLVYSLRFPTYYGYTSPIVENDTLYFSLFVGDGYSFALDSATGAEKKTLKLKDTSVSPLTIAGDYVFMGTSDGSIRSFNRRTWELKWQITSRDYEFDVTSPVVADGVLLFGGARRFTPQSSRAEGTLHALDATTGHQFWMVKIKGVASSPAVDEGIVYFADEDNHLFALDIKTGKEKWSFKASSNIHTHAVSGDRVYFADEHGDLYSADKDSGRLAWKADKVGAARTALALNNGLIYYGGKDNSTYAIDARSGSEKWRFQTRSLCSAPVIAGGLVCFVSGDRFLYAVDAATGQEKWKYKCKNETSISPVITNTTIYLLDDEGYMIGLR